MENWSAVTRSACCMRASPRTRKRILKRKPPSGSNHEDKTACAGRGRSHDAVVRRLPDLLRGSRLRAALCGAILWRLGPYGGGGYVIGGGYHHGHFGSHHFYGHGFSRGGGGGGGGFHGGGGHGGGHGGHR